MTEKLESACGMFVRASFQAIASHEEHVEPESVNPPHTLMRVVEILIPPVVRPPQGEQGQSDFSLAPVSDERALRLHWATKVPCSLAYQSSTPWH